MVGLQRGDVVQAQDHCPSESGKKRTLLTFTGDAVNDGRELFWSMAGNRLTTDYGGLGEQQRETYAWWNLATHRHGRHLAPDSADANYPHQHNYESAARGGWLLDVEGHKVSVEKPGGKLIPLGDAGGDGDLFEPGPDGFLATYGGTRPVVKYQSWSKPRHYVLVKRFKAPYLCDAVDQRNLACKRSGNNTVAALDGLAIQSVALLPLDGGPIRIIRRCANGKKPAADSGFGQPVLVARHLAATGCGAVQFLGESGDLTSVRISPEVAGDDALGAYGEYVFTRGDGHTINAVGPGDRAPRTLVTLR